MGKKFANELLRMRTATFTPLLDIMHCFDAMEYYESFEKNINEAPVLPKHSEDE
jgi:hypothetical protein